MEQWYMKMEKEIVKKISQLIYETGKADSSSEIDSFWWNEFQYLCTDSHGNSFQI